jgi:hypothetical protein
VLLVCAVMFKMVERTYHDALCVFGECDEDGSLYSNSQHEHRLSPVAMPKSYLGRGLDRPETPEADNEAAIDFSPTRMFHSHVK